MRMSLQWAAGIVTLLFALAGAAVETETGPVVKGFGPVIAPPAGAFNLQSDQHYKVSMDVSATGDFAEDRNRHLESAARFLNMHARNGIDPKHIEFAIIVHGAATRDLLSDAAFQKKFDVPNPNSKLLAALADAGVKIYLCSQSAAFKGYSFDQFNPAVTIALSAMSAHVRLQSEGYTLIPF
jgi:intracellular sulfur oxidation DsrE/DsrF family protein